MFNGLLCIISLITFSSFILYKRQIICLVRFYPILRGFFCLNLKYHTRIAYNILDEIFDKKKMEMFENDGLNVIDSSRNGVDVMYTDDNGLLQCLVSVNVSLM